MSGWIAEEAIRAVRERVAIAEIVGESVSLKRRGRGLVGLCPFHAEKTPSFTVNDERGFYHCFGCGEHGDVFAFVMKTRGVSFPEAVEQLAARAGIELPRRAGGGPERPRSAALWEVHRIAQAFYHHALTAESGARARAYLAERGITRASIDRFGIGWAPAAGDALARHLAAAGANAEAAEAAGLVLRGRRGPYDRFRGRIMFPITDASGRVAAFGGRILPALAGGADPPPKYLNSAESPIFHKGRVLYGLGLAREAIRRAGRVLVVEGYLDVVALAQAGIEEVVAPLGTALTADQLRVLRRLTDRVIACFDGDPAGQRAAARSFTTFVEAGLWGHAVFLPEGHDPDSFVRAFGAARLREAVDGASPLVEAFVRSLAASPEAPARQAEAAREVVRVLGRLTDPLEREPLVRLAAHYLGVREQTLERLGAAPPPAAPTPPRDERAAGGSTEAEELLVELLAVDPRLADAVGRDRVLDAIEDPTLHAVAERLLGPAPEAEAGDPLGMLPPALRDRVARHLLEEPDDTADRARMVADCVRVIRQRRDAARQRALRRRLQEAESRGDAAAIADAQRELNTFLSERTSR